MDHYTEFLREQTETLSPDDEDYEIRLREIAELFRGYGEALSDFIADHGYTNALSDVDAKAKFIREKFKAANIKSPRDIKRWFAPKMKPNRDTIFQICFAFRLGVDEANDFFRRVYFERGFDCHTISEAVYYFCMKNNLTYRDTQDIIRRIPTQKKIKLIPQRDVLYTGTIIEYINSIENADELIKYITSNINDFLYNHATAIRFIQELWTEISKEHGLAQLEGKLIKRSFTNEEDYVAADLGASTWTIFSQIIGLRNESANDYAIKYNRSISSVLKKNVLMPLNAGDCFPSQQGIDALMRGELKDNDLIRKMLVLLVFYTYWAKIIIRNNDELYLRTDADSERCFDALNQYLLDAGYQELYAGNPHDWIFMWALNDENPLWAFRFFIGEVFAAKEEEAGAGD
ncbi:MAG: hypothetical protein LUE92_16385 [Clostridiales bacterium]|nr:hypothetical protein [Clostridiales bacterium]